MAVSTALDWEADLALIGDAARQAGAIAMSFFGQAPEVFWKNGGSSPVSAADFAANERLQSLLMAARPDYGWLSEETDDDPRRLSRETVFVVDPIDGTRAFIAGKPTWCVSVAVVHRGRPVAGVLFAPALDEEFLAVVDGPARRNGFEIAVRKTLPDERLNIAAPQDMVNMLSPALRAQYQRVDHIPSLAYRIALIADGRIDATLVKASPHDWDLAAADLILARAGGRLIGLDGEDLRYNRPAVTHGVLVAASAGRIPDLLQAMARLPRG